LICLIFIVWIFATPFWISEHRYLQEKNFQRLFLFDLIFMTDRFFDIFVGFYKPNGELEHRLIYVVFNNLGIKFFLEIGHSMVPWFIHYKEQ